MNANYKRRYACAFLASIVTLGSALAQSHATGEPEIITHRTNTHEAGAPTAGSAAVQTPDITYHGGPVMGTPNVYLIWYGNWNQSNGSDNAGGQTIIRDMLHGINNSPYFQINTSYGTPTGSVNIESLEYADAYSQGSRLSDSKVQAIVNNAINGHLPKDTNALYFVLTSSDVSENSGFCTKYCGWHTAATLSSANIKYSFVGNANRCLNACAAQTTGPNGNAGVDGMVSVMAHELEETTTDPNPRSGWADSNGAENGDKCAWTFGSSQSVASNGAYYNMSMPTAAGGSRNYLIQRNLDASSLCYVNYVSKTQ